MQYSREKLVYVLPEYRNDLGTHFYYNYEFLWRAQKDLNIFVVIEKGERPKNLDHVYVQKFRAAPLRALELFLVFFVLRLRGYSTFWIHYSFIGGLLAPFFGRSFYWNCGMPWLYKRSAFREGLFRFALRNSFLVTGTYNMKKMYTETYELNPEHIIVLPNWIMLERFFEWHGRKKEAREKLDIPESTRVVLFLHRLSERKGANMIVPIAKAFEKDSDVLFLVAGSGPLEGEIVSPNIRRVGEVAQRNVPMYFAASDVFFMPSQEEGFPHVLLEAMALGVPIVATAVGGVEEIVPPILGEFLVAREPHIFAEAIRFLLSHDARREEIAEHEKTWVSQYSLEFVYDAFLKVLARR